ncbi:MAG: 5-formyltetrahydrofolate cyclo-ligase, partial [Chloroflexota bacterium]
VLLTYLPMRGEVDLTALLTRYPGKRWLAPRILPQENYRMALHVYDPQRLARHEFGMLEPAADLPEVPPTEVQMVLTPGLAYDRRGWRLGYGGGYFDRFLQDFEGVSLGVVYAALLLDELPHGTFDVPMDWIVTEAGLLSCHAEAK